MLVFGERCICSMAKAEFFKRAFDELAVDGYIGDPNGDEAYAYIRVSSDGQADEGRSGLPRQIAHIHEIARKSGYKIAWEYVFADDHTGFEFEDRPQLSQLRRELRTPNRRADAVVMEHLDRLSRDADWHQGYLLDEMKKLQVLPIFWKPFNSRIERAVVGAISQEGMEQAKQRMMEGNLHKARDKRVTARTPAYGYKLVDSQGNEGEAAKKDTHYAIRDDEASIVRDIYSRILSGISMRQIAIDLDLAGIRPPKKASHWQPTQIRLLIKNEVYRGDFYAHRWLHTTVQKPSKDGFPNRSVKCKVERPREDWIHIPVPAIVSQDEWEAANRMLEQNKKMARRNAKEPYLLTGLVHCAHCGLKYSGVRHATAKGKPRKTIYRGYRCPYYGIRPKYLRGHHECGNSHIPCSVLDGIVWNVVCRALLEPNILLAALDADAVSQRNLQLLEQVHYLEQEIAGKSDEDEKLWRAYKADAFDEHEFAARRKLLKDEAAKLNENLNLLRLQVLTPEQLEERKKTVLSISEQIKSQNIPVDPPFELKQRIIKLVVDKIVLNVSEGWLQLDGAIHRVILIENTLADMDSLRQRA